MTPCPYCGVEFQQRRRNQIFCSRRCKERRCKERHSKKQPAGEGGRVCPYCRQEFHPRRSDQKYCRRACKKYASRQRCKPPTRIRTVIRTCVECGVEFLGRRKDAVRCSDECRDRASHNPNRPSRSIKREPRLCHRCGVEFTPKGLRNIFCSRRCAKREQHSSRRRRARLGLPPWSGDSSETNVVLGETFGFRKVIAMEKRLGKKGFDRVFIQLRCQCGRTQWKWVRTAKVGRKNGRGGECVSCAATKAGLKQRYILTNEEAQTILVRNIEANLVAQVATEIKRSTDAKNENEIRKTQP